VAKIESNPHAFGRRTSDIRDSAVALFNGRSVLLSGPRGIGKSSLGSQLQTVYGGDVTLLERCDIGTRLPEYLCGFFACDASTTLSELCSELLYDLERKLSALSRLRRQNVKLSIEVDLKVIKARLQADVSARRPATLATELVAGLSEIVTGCRVLGKTGLNLMIDEIDLLPKSMNFGHFIKIVHETLGRSGLDNITFVLAGQRGTYTRLHQEDPSFERLVRHVPIATLEPLEARFVLEYAGDHADPPFAIEPSAADMILALSAGYPYDIHLLGDAAFMAMDEAEFMDAGSVLRGLSDILRSDKREKYMGRLQGLQPNERVVVVSMARYSGKHVPMHIPMKSIARNLLGTLSDGTTVESVVESLVRSGHLIVNREKNYCQFAEELFRVFASLVVIEQRELQEQMDVRQALRKAKKAKDRRREEGMRFAKHAEMPVINDADVDIVLDVLRASDYDAAWLEGDISLLTAPEVSEDMS
jgi:hypothetical protein